MKKHYPGIQAELDARFPGAELYTFTVFGRLPGGQTVGFVAGGESAEVLLESHGPSAPPVPRPATLGDRVVQALRKAGRPLRGVEIADALGHEYDSNLRGLLSKLANRQKRISWGPDGYFV